eukprot:GEMP01092650.1.p1 GENE.GEMP01092650.1~~GEMP01092650.1.p1  ORF type:complete len:106 (-),score=1.07 GEMP01092650.1:458-775(-)
MFPFLLAKVFWKLCDGINIFGFVSGSSLACVTKTFQNKYQKTNALLKTSSKGRLFLYFWTTTYKKTRALKEHNIQMSEYGTIKSSGTTHVQSALNWRLGKRCIDI